MIKTPTDGEFCMCRKTQLYTVSILYENHNTGVLDRTFNFKGNLVFGCTERATVSKLPLIRSAPVCCNEVVRSLPHTHCSALSFVRKGFRNSPSGVCIRAFSITKVC